MVYDKEINGGASSVIVGEGATLDIGTNALHSGGEKVLTVKVFTSKTIRL